MYAICASERDAGGFGGDCEEGESGGGRARRELTGGIAVELWIRNRSRIPPSLSSECVWSDMGACLIPSFSMPSA
ncbi:unnamed protein product [Musa acuminata subsp. burmannicoides]